MTSDSEDTAFQQLREALLLYETEEVDLHKCTPRRPPRWVGCLKDIHTVPLELLFQVRLAQPFIVDRSIHSRNSQKWVLLLVVADLGPFRPCRSVNLSQEHKGFQDAPYE